MKQKIITIMGIDGTGKTTIKKAVEKKSNWKYIIIDRFVDSIIYDELYGRDDREHILYKLENDLSKIAEVYLVYLYCDDKLLLERLEDKNEDKEIIDKIKSSKHLYNRYLKKTKLNKISVDTSKDINVTVDKIINFVEDKR